MLSQKTGFYFPVGFFLVGLGRFELPTSPLSGVRSNQLSYRPSLMVGLGISALPLLHPYPGCRPLGSPYGRTN
jgi:hypothetical protein